MSWCLHSQAAHHVHHATRLQPVPAALHATRVFRSPRPSWHHHHHLQQQQEKQHRQHGQQAGPHGVQRLQHVRTHAAAEVGGSAAWQSSGQPWTRLLPKSTKYDDEMFHLAIPALAAMLLDPIMNMVTAAMLGHLGTQQLGAVSLANLAVSFAIYTFSFLVFLTTPRIAAAHVAGDKDAVSRLAGVGLWLAGGCGLVTTLGVMLLAGPIVTALRPAEAAVAQYAVEYMRVRSTGIMAAMLGFVAAATYRGVKDTRTPLIAAVGAMCTNLVLTPLFLYVFDWGVVGAAMAASISQYISAGILLVLLVKRRLMNLSHLWEPPALGEVAPYMGQALVLAFRIVVAFGMVMYASAVCVRAGAASQAAFEIIRQVWVLSIQLFECLNVAMQSMCASYLGAGDRQQAQAVLWRAMELATGCGLLVGAVLCLAQGPIVALFTHDSTVALAAGAVMPMIAFLMPFDAGASIVDGGLIAASQTNMLSAIQVGGSIAQHFVLTWVVTQGAVSVFSVWAVLKMMTAFRLAGGYYINFHSPWSAYVKQPLTGGSGSSNSSSSASSNSSSGSGSSDSGTNPATSSSSSSNGSGSSSISSSNGSGSSMSVDGSTAAGHAAAAAATELDLVPAVVAGLQPHQELPGSSNSQQQRTGTA